MAIDIGALLEEYAEFRELVRTFVSVPYCGDDPARAMLERGFAELYDVLLKAQGFLESWKREEELWKAQEKEMHDALKVTWIPCEERMPDHDRPVWICDPSEALTCKGPVDFADGWDADLGEWWIGDRPHAHPEITHWAELRWPASPQKGDDDA